jgi:hypothetical protein
LPGIVEIEGRHVHDKNFFASTAPFSPHVCHVPVGTQHPVALRLSTVNHAKQHDTKSKPHLADQTVGVKIIQNQSSLHNVMPTEEHPFNDTNKIALKLHLMRDFKLYPFPA